MDADKIIVENNQDEIRIMKGATLTYSAYVDRIITKENATEQLWQQFDKVLLPENKIKIAMKLSNIYENRV
jgi:UDP-3-O-acyl-N-acetylglucosamine deacetylase